MINKNEITMPIKEEEKKEGFEDLCKKYGIETKDIINFQSDTELIQKHYQ